LPRLLHPPAPPGLRLRVAPYPAPFLLSRRPNPQVAPWLRPFGCAGDVRPSYPELRMPSTVLVSARFRVAPVSPAFSCSAPDVELGFPLVPHLRLYRRWIIESPRFSHLSAVPSCWFLSCPKPSHSVSPTIRRPGCPKLRILRHRLMDIRVTSDHAPSGSPWLNLRVAPDTLLWLRQLTNFQVALNLGSLAVRRFSSLRVAPNLGSSADPYLLPRVAPLSHLRLSR